MFALKGPHDAPELALEFEVKLFEARTYDPPIESVRTFSKFPPSI
jgi:hypothetical protein